MSTIKDFENAPTGATAINSDGGRAMKMAVIEMSCAGTCGRAIRVTDTSSLYKPDGTPWRVFHGACYMTKGEKND